MIDLQECRVSPVVIFARQKNSRHNALATSPKSELDRNAKPLGEKVKETTKTASYLGVILLGVAVTGTLFYAIFQELFSSKSPNNIYSQSSKKCIADPRVEDKLGLPISAFGEESRRRRRQHVSHVVYQKDGRKHLRMKFYLQGSYHRGTVHLEMAENDAGQYVYRYMFVTVNDLSQSTIVIEDNRNKLANPMNTISFAFE
ncbi:hypothetical protein Trydic_g12666 [Trypoxylus dichotomus]